MDRRRAIQTMTGLAASVSLSTRAVAAADSATPSQAAAARLPRLRVHEGGRFLERAGGRPFFWLGDTAWLVIHRAAPHEASYYLQTRARQGFSVIQVSLLSEIDGLRTPSEAGELPFDEADPLRPREPFFRRAADFFQEAESLGLYVAVVAAWGDKLTAPWGSGPRVFTVDDLDVPRKYGHYLGTRFREHPNLVWLMGGDRPPRLSGGPDSWSTRTGTQAGFPADQNWIPVWRAMAEGIRDGAGQQALMSYHPAGGRDGATSLFLQDEPWLDIHGMQSGHGGGRDVPVWEWIERDFALAPPRPTLDLEPNYEDHPYNPWPKWDPATGYFRDHDVRKQCYRSVFAGGCGVTYGHHSVWQWHCDRYEAVNFPDRTWVDALNRPAAREMIHLRRLMESRPCWSRIPDQSLLAGDAGAGGSHVCATRDAEATYALFYFPQADQRVRLDLKPFAGKTLRAWWYDPRNGFPQPLAGPTLQGEIEIVSPSRGPDWVLALDDAAANYAPPGLSVWSS